MSKKIQVIKHPCCDKIFAACVEPDCYTDLDWVKELKKYVIQGKKVDLIEQGQGLQFGKCDCKEKQQPKLF